jgi:DNA-binding PadR family transcriptional regulator
MEAPMTMDITQTVLPSMAPRPPRRGPVIRAIGRVLLKHPEGLTEYELTRLLPGEYSGSIHNALWKIDHSNCSLVTVTDEIHPNGKKAKRYRLTERGVKYAKGRKRLD